MRKPGRLHSLAASLRDFDLLHDGASSCFNAEHLLFPCSGAEKLAVDWEFRA